MSYLDFPRINVAGRFFTDPSTVDNDPDHYKPEVTDPSPWQMPNGLHYFQFRGCQVVNAWDQTGANQPGDPLVGLNLETTDDPSPAKIVDLDVYQQGISTIFGLNLRLSFGDGSTLVGAVDPTVLNSCWFNAVLPERGWNMQYGWGSPGGDFNACGYYQSVVRFDAAKLPRGKSPVLDQLIAASATVKGQVLFSLRMVVDGYDNVSGGWVDGDLTKPVNPGYQLGRMNAVLGPYKAGEPIQAPGPRWLVARPLVDNAAWNDPSLNSIPFSFNSQTKILSIDWANGVCRSYPGGPVVDLGTLSVSIKVPGLTFVEVGSVTLSSFGYDTASGIADIKVTNPTVAEKLLSCPLVLLSQTKGALFQEAKDGLFLAADDRSIRMTSEPNSPYLAMPTRVRATRWGLPVSGLTVKAQIVPVKGDTPGCTAPWGPGDSPTANGALAAQPGVTDAQGWATLSLKAQKDPGSRTPQLDGQLYFLWLYTAAPYDPKVGAGQEQTVSVLLWSSYTVNPNPSFEVFRNLMVPYMKLFPGMRARMDLTDKNTVFIFSANPPWTRVYGPNTPPFQFGDYTFTAGAIPFYLTRDVTDPRYMPLTRDLSPNKVKTLLYYAKIVQQTPAAAKENP